MNEPVSQESAGLGDTFAKIALAVGATWAAKNYEKITGKDCGCKKRQEALNRMVPYKRTMLDPPESERSWG